MNKLESLNIPAWGSEEALRKEEHLSRFMEREYISLMEEAVSISDLAVDPTAGSLTEQTESLMQEHYDKELFLFKNFLDDRYMAYTMAYYGSDANAVGQCHLSIEEAQAEKFRLICERIGIVGNERILNIGCGFGSFERYLLENYNGIEVVGITPSHVQANYIRECMNESSHVFHSGNFTLVESTFEALDQKNISKGCFDIVTSIGLLEAIRNLQLFNAMVSECLRPGGKAFHHAIVSKMVLPQTLNAEKTIIGTYFPGGRVWPLNELSLHTGMLNFEQSWFVNGMNYWKTLDEWHCKFWENISDLQKKLSGKEISYWNDYFILCKACFRPLSGTAFGNGHYLFRKPK